MKSSKKPEKLSPARQIITRFNMIIAFIGILGAVADLIVRSRES